MITRLVVRGLFAWLLCEMASRLLAEAFDITGEDIDDAIIAAARHWGLDT